MCKWAIFCALEHLRTCTLAYLRNYLHTCVLAHLSTRALHKYLRKHLRIHHLCTYALVQVVTQELAQVVHLHTLAYLRTCASTCTLTHLCKCLCTYALAQILLQALASTCALAQALTHLRICARFCALTHLNICALASVLVHLRNCALTQLHLLGNSRILAQVHKYLCTYVLAQVLAHLYICALTHLSICKSSCALTHLHTFAICTSTNVHSKHSRLVQWWASVCKTGLALKQH